MPGRQWITTCDTQVQCMCTSRQPHACVLAEKRHSRAASSRLERIICRWYSSPREMNAPSTESDAHIKKVNLHLCVISTRHRAPKHVRMHTCKHTWQVLSEILPLMWQTNILNHLVRLNFHLVAAAPFQPGVEVDVLLHCQPAEVKIISWRPFDRHVRRREWPKRASPATHLSVWHIPNVTLVYLAKMMHLHSSHVAMSTSVFAWLF